jgi:hypothetical protein
VIKKTFEEVLKAWEAARLSAKSREDFQAKWSKVLEDAGWTRQEFHADLDDKFAEES